MITATEFLLGALDQRGRSLETYLSADVDWLEDRHDWVQWAFPNREPSVFNPEAPLWTPGEAAALPDAARANLARLLARYRVFLSRMRCWRCGFDHRSARLPCVCETV